MKRLDWTSYVKSQLDESNFLSNLKITLSNNASESLSVPPIVRLSINLINRLIDANERHVVVVFPEKTQTLLLLAIFKVISDIMSGQAEMTYDPSSFKQGQKLKCENCVVEFERVDEWEGKTLIYIRTADTKQATNCFIGMPMDIAPFFQLTDTKRPLSNDKVFSKMKAELRTQKAAMSASHKLMSILIDYKTHINNTIFYVGPTGKAQEQLSELKIDNIGIKDSLLIGHADMEGNIDILNKGQLSGNPEIVLASDLYVVNEAIKRDTDVKLLMVDVSNLNILESQLDVLDELCKKIFPIICLTDTVNSFNLDALEQRNFAIWRWDDESISRDLYETSNTINNKVRNCIEQNIEYLKCDSNELTAALSILYTHRAMIADSTPNMLEIYESLFSIAFTALRSITVLREHEQSKIDESLALNKVKLQKEKRFVSPEIFGDFEKAIKSFDSFFNRKYIFPKIEALQEKLRFKQYKTACIVISDRADKEYYLRFWNDYCVLKGILSHIVVMRQTEYYNYESVNCEVTIVCGWFNNSSMKRILYSYKTQKYLVLLYDYEERWKSPHIKIWNKILHKGSNKRIIENVLSLKHTDFLEYSTNKSTQVAQQDELDEIELVLRENRFRKYVSNGGSKAIGEVTEALPINYVGGNFAFYKTSHKLVSVTDIVLENKGDFKMLLPTELKMGDFIVVREAQHDLIRELADSLLRNSGKEDARNLARKWLDALNMESVFSNLEEIYQKLRHAGCTKNQVTIRQWMKNEDIIAPHDKDDLVYIAKATEDAVLLEKMDAVYEAGKEVKRAHIQAGKTLSVLLKRQIAKRLQELGGIDPYNIWEPITLQLDEIGTVKVLKVIDIGSVMMVDSSTINRLLDE